MLISMAPTAIPKTKKINPIVQSIRFLYYPLAILLSNSHLEDSCALLMNFLLIIISSASEMLYLSYPIDGLSIIKNSPVSSSI